MHTSFFKILIVLLFFSVQGMAMEHSSDSSSDKPHRTNSLSPRSLEQSRDEQKKESHHSRENKSGSENDYIFSKNEMLSDNTTPKDSPQTSNLSNQSTTSKQNNPQSEKTTDNNKEEDSTIKVISKLTTEERLEVLE